MQTGVPNIEIGLRGFRGKATVALMERSSELALRACVARLREANETLEAKVEERTRALFEIELGPGMDVLTKPFELATPASKVRSIIKR